MKMPIFIAISLILVNVWFYTFYHGANVCPYSFDSYLPLDLSCITHIHLFGSIATVILIWMFYGLWLYFGTLVSIFRTFFLKHKK